MTMTATEQQRPGFLNAAPDNWKLAIALGLGVSVLAASLLPAAASFWVVGAMAAMVAASFVVYAYRRHYYGGLLV
jgi:multiple sugar transport system permease protein